MDGTAELTAWDVKRLRMGIEAAGVALWSWNVDTDQLTMDERSYGLWGLPRDVAVSFEDLSGHIHPADRDRVRAAFAATRALVGPYEIDFRIMVDGKIRWISARGQGDDADIVGETMFGIFLNVTGRKQVEEGHELLAGEMSHRVKNLLAVAAGLTAITSRSTKTTVEYGARADPAPDRTWACPRPCAAPVQRGSESRAAGRHARCPARAL